MEQKLSKSLAENLGTLQKLFLPSEDFYIKPVRIGGAEGALCNFEGLADLEKLWVMAVQAMNHLSAQWTDGEKVLEYLLTQTAVPLDKKIAVTVESAVKYLTSGATVIFLEGCERALVVSSQGQASRSVSEPSEEGNLRGSHEGFVELLRINLSLIRRLVRTPELHSEIFTVGKATKTEVALLYHGKSCSPQMVAQVKKRIEHTGLSLIFDPGYLSAFITRTPFSLFMPLGFTERPDTAAAKICEGKIILLVNGSPFAMIVPFFFREHFQSMDDYVQRPYFVSFIRLLRYMGFFLAVFLPGLFVAVANFTPELFPSLMLYKIAASERATPMPLFVELLIVNLLLEIIREAGLRMPKPIGHSVSLVSALIIGDAAIRVGMLGTPVIVVCALASLCSFVVPSLYEPGIVLRLVFILVGGIAGPVGLTMVCFLLLLNLCRPDPFGVPYTAPLTPYSPALWRDGVLRASWRELVREPGKDSSGPEPQKAENKDGDEKV